MTLTLVAVIGLAFAITSAFGALDQPFLLGVFGSKRNDLILEGQVWRLVTALFLHSGWLHVIVNGATLLVFGGALEALIGPARYLSVFMFCGVVGTGASFWASTDPSVGASGALLGILGCLTVLVLRHRKRLIASEGRRFRRWLPPLALFLLAGVQLLLGHTLTSVDNAAHIGGLVAGLLAGVLVHPQRLLGTRGAWPAAIRRLLAALCVGLLLAGLAGILYGLLPLRWLPRGEVRALSASGDAFSLRLAPPWSPLPPEASDAPGVLRLRDGDVGSVLVFSLPPVGPGQPFPDPRSLLIDPLQDVEVSALQSGALPAGFPGIGLWCEALIHPRAGPPLRLRAAVVRKSGQLFALRSEVLEPFRRRYGDLLAEVAGGLVPGSTLDRRGPAKRP